MKSHNTPIAGIGMGNNNKIKDKKQYYNDKEESDSILSKNITKIEIFNY